MLKRFSPIFIVFSSLLVIAGCTPPQPNNVDNVCQIFRQFPQWYWAAQRSEKKWGVPINLQMAVMHQESRFQPKAKPPRRKLLWFIPWLRPSSAYGYAQVLDTTWEHYKKQTGLHGADRDNFKDAINFVGWYANKAHERLGFPVNDAYSVYLAYHEGMGGFERQTYKKKPWLMNVARKVQRRNWTYSRQLKACQASLPKHHWWYFWA